MDTPQIEVLWWAGCPSTGRAVNELRGVMDELGMDPAGLRLIELRTEEEALERGFAGSPTILIDGSDPFVNGEDEVGLSCRVYRRRDGRVSPVPDPDELREALRR